MMNLLTDNLTADSGKIFMERAADFKIRTELSKKCLGICRSNKDFIMNLPGGVFLAYVAALKGLSKKTVPHEIERVSHLVNLQDELDKLLGAYSGGMKQRILIAQAIMGNPELLIFDEPPRT